MHLNRIVEDIARNEGRRILAGLIRLTGDFDRAEEALQEAFVKALGTWARAGVPANPGAWLNTVARRNAIDHLRRDQRRLPVVPLDHSWADVESEESDPSGIGDDRLRLLFTCCHPALAPEARCALALRTLGGLSTREIARAFIEPEATTAQRLVRAKKKIRESAIPYEIPAREKLGERTAIVLSVVYLIFNEGYASTSHASLLRPDLSAEAIRLGRVIVELLPGEAEAAGLLALMLLTEARRNARLSHEGELVPLEEQDRELWDEQAIDEGRSILDHAVAMGSPGPYQTLAAVAALHGDASSVDETDWPQIAALYRALERRWPTPVVALNAAVAEAMATSLERGLARILQIEEGGALASYHLLFAAKADVLRRLGRTGEAAESYRRALALVTNEAERRYLRRRLTSCTEA
jgi:RNA polymerase sigma-70 factor, ECF subfamily